MNNATPNYEGNLDINNVVIPKIFTVRDFDGPSADNHALAVCGRKTVAHKVDHLGGSFPCTGGSVRSDRTIGRSPNSHESGKNSTNTSTGPQTAMSAQQWRQ
jgi:hypothetical protein